MESPPAPVGRIGLVFTDVQGSTALWEHAPDAMRAALHLHDACLRAQLEACGGYEVKTEGDAFMCAFADAADAVRWAVSVQAALAAVGWPMGLAANGLAVRAGVHAGEPECRLDPLTGRMDYFGPVVNRAARIAQAAHGGQVLVGGAAWEAARGRLGDVSVHDLGEHALRGLTAPERLWQVLPVELAQRQFPRPNTVQAQRTNLAPPAASMVGREEALEALIRLTHEARLVTVTGAAGVGKSRLAHGAAWLTLAEWPGGAVWCDLAGLSTVDAVCAAVAAALEVPLVDSDPVGRIGHALHARGRCLLVLDNADAAVGIARQTVLPWHDRAPAASVLTTSRALLGLRGERVFRVEPLALPRKGSPVEESAAVALFVARAREVAPGFALGPANAADVARIVTQLDGLPLAIELAAARAGILSPGALADRLGERFAVLADRRRGDRQATLRAAFDASWSALGPWERAAFTQLCAFEGTFDLEDAEAVVDLGAIEGAPLAMDAVQALIECSLVHGLVTGGELRFRVLTTLRAFGREQPGYEAAVARHGAWYASRGAPEALEALFGPDGAARVARLVEEQTDLLAAVERAIARREPSVAVLAAFAALEVMLLTGPMEAARALAERLIALDGVDPRALVSLRVRHSFVLRALGRGREAEAAGREALELARALGAPDLVAAALHGLAACLRALGQPRESRALLDEALPLVTDAHLSRLIRVGQCDSDRYAGDLAGAVRGYEAELASLQASPAPRVEATLANNLAAACIDLQRPAEARRALVRALAAARAVGDRRTEALALGNLGLVEQSEGSTERARSIIDAALAMARELGERSLEAHVLGYLGVLELETGHPEAAGEHFDAALAVARDGALRRLEGNLLGQGALCRIDLGDREAGREGLVAAVAAHRETGNLRWEGWTLAVLAHLALDAGRPEEAAAHVAEARQRTGKAGIAWTSGVITVAEARLRLVSGTPGAAGVAEEALAAIGTAGSVEQVLALTVLSEARRVAGEPAAARAAVEAAEAILLRKGLRRRSWLAAVAAARAALGEP